MALAARVRRLGREIRHLDGRPVHALRARGHERLVVGRGPGTARGPDGRRGHGGVLLCEGVLYGTAIREVGRGIRVRWVALALALAVVLAWVLLRHGTAGVIYWPRAGAVVPARDCVAIGEERVL